MTCGCVYFSSAGASAVSMGTSGLFREEESQVSVKISEFTLKSQCFVSNGRRKYKNCDSTIPRSALGRVSGWR